MNLYIKIEIKVRELESKLVLAMAAAEKGFDVLLGADELTLNLVRKKILKPGIILEKSITPAKRRINQLLEYKKYNCIVTSIDEEGGFIANDYKEFMSLRYSNKTIKLTDKIFTWGKYDFEYLRNNFKSYRYKFSNTGNPRVDFWRKEFDKFYDNELYLKKKKLKNYLLLSSNFGGMVQEKRIWEFAISNRESQYFENGQDEFDFHKFNAYQIKLNSEFIFALRKLTKKFKKLKIIIRPHPNESIEAWHGLMGKFKNIHIIKHGSIGNWIRNARIVLHNSCTSGIESSFSDIPTISYRPYKSKYDRKFPNLVSQQAFNYKQLEKLVKINLSKKKLLNKKNIFLKRFQNLKNQFAFEKIVQEWLTFDSKKLSKKNNLFLISIIAKYRSLRLKISFRNIFIKNKKKIINHQLTKFPEISKSELNKIENKIKLTLNRFNNVKVQLISGHLIRVSKK